MIASVYQKEVGILSVRMMLKLVLMAVMYQEILIIIVSSTPAIQEKFHKTVILIQVVPLLYAYQQTNSNGESIANKQVFKV